MTTIQDLQNKVVALTNELDATYDNFREDILYSELREVNHLLDASLRMAINDTTRVLQSDLVTFKPTVQVHHADGREELSKTSFLVKLRPEVVVAGDAIDPCGSCEECWTNGMPQYCMNPQRVPAWYYQKVDEQHRIYGDPENGFYLSVIKP